MEKQGRKGGPNLIGFKGISILHHLVIGIDHKLPYAVFFDLSLFRQHALKPLKPLHDHHGRGSRLILVFRNLRLTVAHTVYLKIHMGNFIDAGSRFGPCCHVAPIYIHII